MWTTWPPKQRLFRLPATVEPSPMQKKCVGESLWVAVYNMMSGLASADITKCCASILNFYLNRADTNPPPRRRRILQQAKTELRRLYGEEMARPAVKSEN
ncbi:MAG: DUF3175 domain-containing protein [Candidatus Kerfeldbacteria bacterium]|nr:DUF3175 domain-containing protein [Candidatus Kerfeldbacteria bacterium]